MSHQNEKLWSFRPKTVPVRGYWVPAHRRRKPQPVDPSRQRLIDALRRRFNLC